MRHKSRSLWQDVEIDIKPGRSGIIAAAFILPLFKKAFSGQDEKNIITQWKKSQQS